MPSLAIQLYQDLEGNSLLHHAVKQAISAENQSQFLALEYWKAVIELLLQQGADVGIRNCHHYCPVDYAWEHRCDWILELLFKTNPGALQRQSQELVGEVILHTPPPSSSTPTSVGSFALKPLFGVIPDSKALV